MAHVSIEDLIDMAFRRHLNTSIPALKELFGIISTTPEMYTLSICKRFFNKISDLSDLTERQRRLINSISQEIVKERGIDSIQIEKMLSGLNKYAIEIVLSVNSFFLKEKGEYYIVLLYSTLQNLNTKDEVYYNILNFLISTNDDTLIRICKSDILELYDWKIYGPLSILSQIGDDSLCGLMLEILQNTMEGINYDDSTDDIRLVIMTYLKRVKCKDSVNVLLKLMEEYQGNRDKLNVISESLSNIGFEIIEPSFSFLEKHVISNKNLIVENILIALNSLSDEDLLKIDYQKLLKILHPSPMSFFGWNELIKLTKKLDDRVKPSLITLLKSDHNREHDFAKECLEARGENIYEILEKNPVIEIYNLFYNELTDRRNGWEIQGPLLDKQFKPNLPKGNKLSFEHGVESLLASCGFTTLWVEPSGVKGIDIIAFSQDNKHILLLGCTTGVLKDDLDKIFEITPEVRNRIKNSTIHPIICTNLDRDKILKRVEAAEHGIGILSANELSHIFNMSKSDRPHEEILSHILRVSMMLSY